MSIHSRMASGICQPVVDLGQPVGLLLELPRQPGQVLEEPDDLVDERGQRQVQELEEEQDAMT